MEPEIGLIMNNLTRVEPEMKVLNPFIGGSSLLLVTCNADRMRSLTIDSRFDGIDWRIIHHAMILASFLQRSVALWKRCASVWSAHLNCAACEAWWRELQH
jgi:hypothetical protein